MQYKTAHILSDAEAAYLAGMIDGEGTITMQKCRASQMRFPAMLIASTSFELVDVARQLTGIGTISTKRLYREHHRRSYHWQVCRRQCLDVGRMILPFMHEKAKRRRLELLLNQWAPLVRRNGQYSQQEKEALSVVAQDFFADAASPRMRKL